MMRWRSAMGRSYSADGRMRRNNSSVCSRACASLPASSVCVRIKKRPSSLAKRHHSFCADVYTFGEHNQSCHGRKFLVLSPWRPEELSEIQNSLMDLVRLRTESGLDALLDVFLPDAGDSDSVLLEGIAHHAAEELTFGGVNQRMRREDFGQRRQR